MQLKSVKFIEFKDTSQEWVLEGLILRDRNLIVGKNASGKSRTLNVIGHLAMCLAGLKTIAFSGCYDFEFIDGDQTFRYQLAYEEGEIIMEKYSVGSVNLLDRGKDGVGKISAEALDDGKRMIQFQTPTNKLAAVAKRDNIQHPFLEKLYEWGSSLRHYRFGTALGKDYFAVFVEDGIRKLNERDANDVVAIFQQGKKEFNKEFMDQIIHDMKELDYDIEEIGLRPPVSMRVISGPEMKGLYVKEKGLTAIIDQHSISQGMFRALSLLIQINYSQMAKKSTCIMIDDIGEGLDFDRSCRLIDLLRKKAADSFVQLILSTNDRFVMNKVPLEEWSVLQRHGSIVQVRNYENSKEIFEEFRFTGLSNFSFLEMDFISGEPKETDMAHE